MFEIKISNGWNPTIRLLAQTYGWNPTIRLLAQTYVKPPNRLQI